MEKGKRKMNTGRNQDNDSIQNDEIAEDPTTMADDTSVATFSDETTIVASNTRHVMVSWSKPTFWKKF